MDNPIYFINTEFNEDGNRIILALLQYKVSQAIKLGEGVLDVPSISLTPDEARDLIEELSHYVKAAVGGDA